MAKKTMTKEEIEQKKQDKKQAKKDKLTSLTKEERIVLLAERWRKNYGDNVVRSKMSQVIKQEDVIPTRIPSLDWALGIGGIARGRIYEFYGDPASGKTALMLHIMAEFQKRGLTCMFIDAEHTFDGDFARIFGVDVEGNLFIEPIQPDTLEDAFDIMEEAIEDQTVDIIGIDSIAALVPEKYANDEREMSEMSAMYTASCLGHRFKKIVPVAAKGNVTIIFINHTYESQDQFAKYKEANTKGGKTIKFNEDVRLSIATKGGLRNNKDHVIGSKVKYKVWKNKMSYNGRSSELVRLHWSKGFITDYDIVRSAIKFGIITVQGAWLQFGEEKHQGLKKMYSVLKDNKDMLSSLKELVYEEVRKQRYMSDDLAEIDEEKTEQKNKDKDSDSDD